MILVLIFSLLLLRATTLITLSYINQNRSLEDFYLGRRRVGWTINGSAIAGEYLSVILFLGLAGITFTNGYNGAFYAFALVSGLVMLNILVAGPLRRLEIYTFPEFMEQRFQTKGSRVTGIIVVLAISFFFAAPLIVLSAELFKNFLGISYTFGVFLTVILLSLYVVFGGMMGITANQFLSLWVRSIAILLLFFIALYAGFNYGNIMEIILNTNVSASNPIHNGQDWGTMGSATLKHLLGTFSMVCGLMFAAMGFPHIMMRYFTSPSEHEARKSGLFAAFLVALFALIIVYLGAVVRAIYIQGELDYNTSKVISSGDINMILPALANTLGGNWC